MGFVPFPKGRYFLSERQQFKRLITVHRGVLATAVPQSLDTEPTTRRYVASSVFAVVGLSAVGLSAVAVVATK